MTDILALDISHYQDISSWSDIKNAGVVGILHKATEGTSYVDPTYAPRMQQAIAAGLKWGAYHFLKHGDATSQMEHFVETAGLDAGSRVAIDYEDAACDLDDLAEALAQIETIDPTLQICIYSGHLLKEQVGSAVYDFLTPYALWLAQYTTGTPSWPKQIWPTWSLWQFSDSGKVKGVNGPVDTNYFNGTAEQCAAWFGPSSGDVVPPIPDEPEVVINIEVPDGIAVRININGEPM